MVAEPTIARIVLYKSRSGLVLPAIVTATFDTLDPRGVALYRKTASPGRSSESESEDFIDVGAEGVPPLDSPLHVHLTVFSPGLPGNGDPPAGLDSNAGGTYREWNVPPASAGETRTFGQLAQPGAAAMPIGSATRRPDGSGGEWPSGSWAWPERR